jgi:hypothetical protein
MKPKTPAAGSHSDLDKFIDDLDDLSIQRCNNLPWVGLVKI